MPTSVRIPLFALHAVLFPGAVLPLHVFEPRCRQMIANCLRQESVFGVVLIRTGAEVGEPAEPYEVGTTARIVHIRELQDGRYGVLAEGASRFRIEFEAARARRAPACADRAVRAGSLGDRRRVRAIRRLARTHSFARESVPWGWAYYRSEGGEAYANGT